MSMPLEVGEQTGISIEHRRCPLDDQPPAKTSRGSFDAVRGSDRIDNLTALGTSNASKPRFHDSVLRIAHYTDGEDLAILKENPSLQLVLIHKCCVSSTDAA